MAGLDDLLQPRPTNTFVDGDKEYSWVDADTIRDAEDNRYRIQGVGAPETSHFTSDGLKVGEVGGQATQEAYADLANSMGFTQVVPVGTDDFGRTLIELKDKNGRSFRQALAREGLADIDQRFDTTGLSQTEDYGAFLRTEPGREETEWDKARAMIDQAVAEDQRFQNQFKVQQTIAGDARYSDAFSGASAAFEYDDRATDTGKSLNPLSDAWDTGLIGVAEASYGIAELLGEKVDWQGLEQFGTAGVNRARARIGDRGHFITDYKDVDGFWDAIEYVSNNAALSLPYMGISVAGAVAAPFTGGLSLAAPAAVYTGMTWNEMGTLTDGERSATVAIAGGVAQAALDRIGLGAIAKGFTGPPKQLLTAGINKLVADGMTKEAATQTVMAATRKELAGFAGDAAKVAADQLRAKQLFKSLVGKGAVGLSGEAVTESLQELTAYTAAHIGAEGALEKWDWNELNDRLAQAAVAGGTLGGAFSVPGTLYDIGAWKNVEVQAGLAQEERLSDSGRHAEQEIENFGRIKSVEELAAEARAGVATTSNPGATLDERADADRQRRKDRTWGEAFTETALSAPALWRGATRFIFTPEIKSQSRAARILADMFGGNLQKTFSGSSFENAKHHKVSSYKNMVTFPQKAWTILGGGKKLGVRERQRVSDQTYAILRAAIDPETKKFDPNLIPEGTPNKQFLIQLAGEMQRLSNKMYADQKQFNPDLGFIDNYLMRYKAFDKRAIKKNKLKFIQALVRKHNMSESDAKNIADAILNNTEVNDFAEAFSVTNGGPVPGSHQKRSLNLAEDPDFVEFMERDIYANISQAAKSAARYTAHQEYVGQNGEIISHLLNQMQADGVAPETVNRVAKQMKDYLDAESGNYKRPTSEAGKNAQTLQRNFMMITTLAGLPLATISSFVELALTMRALTLDQIMGKDKKGGLRAMGTELGQTLINGAEEIGGLVGVYGESSIPETEGKQHLRDLGYYDWDVGAATTTGATEIAPWQQHIFEKFFKWTGLQGWTNYTRAVRAAMAGDYITGKLDTIIKGQGQEKTNEVQEAEEALRNLGINVQDLLAAYRGGGFDPAMADVVETNFREGMFNFVNDAVALPQSANRPLIYQDPRFALFTQFQGFIATFTANHLPKLWGEYVKRGTPAMKYNAFAVMATMIMLGFASQYLKDWLKYGKHTPYLDDAEWIQRGIRSSGLLGTGERVLDQFFPLYEERSRGTGEWLINTTTGEAPALSNLKRLGKATGHVLTGDISRGGKQILKSTPVLGPFNPIVDFLSGNQVTWGYRGEK